MAGGERGRGIHTHTHLTTNILINLAGLDLAPG